MKKIVIKNKSDKEIIIELWWRMLHYFGIHWREITYEKIGDVLNSEYLMGSEKEYKIRIGICKLCKDRKIYSELPFETGW